MYVGLLKVFLKQQFSYRRLFGGDIAQSRFKRWLFSGLLIYVGAVTLLGNWFLFFDAAQALKDAGMLDYFLRMAFANLIGLTVLFTLFQASGLLFDNKDFDLLAPLPIQHRTVVTAKLTMMLLFILLFSLLMNGGIIGLYYYFSPFNFLSIITFFPLYAIVPIPVMVFVSLVALGIDRLAARFVKKSTVNIVLLTAFLIGYFGISLLSVDADLLAFFQPIQTFFQMFYAPANWFVEAIDNGNLLSVVWLLLSHGFVLVIAVMLLTPLTLYTNRRKTMALKAKVVKKTAFKSKPFWAALILKEWSLFLNTPSYFINCGFGVIVMLILSTLSFWFKESLLTGLGLVGLPAPWAIMAVLGFSTSTVYTPAISLSLEGKNFAMLKALPIPGRTVLLSKAAFNMTVLTLPLVLSVVLFGVAFEMGWWQISLMLIALWFFALLLSLSDLFFNLWFPKFDFQNEVEVVKQSLASFFAVMFGVGLLAFLGYGAYVLYGPLNLESTLLIAILLQGIAVATLLTLLLRFGNRWYQKLSGF